MRILIIFFSTLLLCEKVKFCGKKKWTKEIFCKHKTFTKGEILTVKNNKIGEINELEREYKYVFQARLRKHYNGAQLCFRKFRNVSKVHKNFL